jgi:hypothetical protein
MTDPFFNYYAAEINKSRPLGTVTLTQFFEAIKNPKPHILEIYDRIYRADQEGNKELKAELKTHLYSFTPCVVINGRRRYEDIVSFTGLMMLDFDKIDNAQEFKEFLFNTYDFIIGTWLSASKRGVRALVNIPYVETVDEFKSLFAGIEHEEMGQYHGFDTAPKNPVLPLFLSHDPDIYIGDTQGIWNITYNPPVSKPVEQYKFDGDPTRVERIIKSAIDKITDNGHPQLRSAAYTMGGYVGSGNISMNRAVEFIHQLIDHNEYLSIKPAVYKRTAEEMIIKGSNDPLYL